MEREFVYLFIYPLLPSPLLSIIELIKSAGSFVQKKNDDDDDDDDDDDATLVPGVSRKERGESVFPLSKRPSSRAVVCPQVLYRAFKKEFIFFTPRIVVDLLFVCVYYILVVVLRKNGASGRDRNANRRRHKNAAGWIRRDPTWAV